jgi:hypothetical protein
MTCVAAQRFCKCAECVIKRKKGKEGATAGSLAVATAPL